MAKDFIIPPPLPALNNQFLPRYFFDPEDSDLPAATSMLGTPVWSNLTFLADDVDVGRPTTVDPNAGKRDLRIDTVIMSVQNTKNIVKTVIVGRAGTIKEFISMGDYMVTIDAVLVSNEMLKYPVDDLDLLRRYCELSTQIGVSSFFLDAFNIHSVVIESYEIAEKIGSRNEIPFRILASSDQPIEFTLNPRNGL